jgi:hypothetical protein
MIADRFDKKKKEKKKMKFRKRKKNVVIHDKALWDYA